MDYHFPSYQKILELLAFLAGLIFGLSVLNAAAESAADLRNLLARRPNWIAGRVALCEFYFEQRDFRAAEHECELARQKGGAAEVVLPLLGQTLLAQNRASEVLTRIKPPNPIATRLRGILALLYGQANLMMKNFSGAQASFNIALTLGEVAGAARIGLAWAALEQKQLERAANEISQAEALNAHPKEIALVKAELLRRQARPEAARTQFIQVLSHDPRHLSARLGKAAMELALGAIATARADLSIAAAITPDHPLVKRLQGWLAVENGPGKELLIQINALDRNASPAALLPIADLLARVVTTGHLQVALLAARQLQNRVPQAALGYASEGAVRMIQRDWRGATRALAAAYRREPTTLLAHNLSLTRTQLSAGSNLNP